jgi:hypothetical protein
MATPVTIGATKFGRTYQLQVDGLSSTPTVPYPITVGFPITLELNVVHNIFAAANTGDFSLYNLSSTNISQIAFSTYLKAQPYRIQLRAGYLSQQPGITGSPSSLPVVFNGFVDVAFTERSGPNLITRINAFDNGDITSDNHSICFGPTNSYTATAGTLFPAMVQDVMRRLTPNGISVGQVILNTAQIAGKPAMTSVVTKDRNFATGRVWEALENLAAEAGTGTYVYIENGVVNMLGPKDILPAPNSLGVLQSSTGLLNIPKYTDSTILCSMIFEPSLTIGAQIELNSTYNTRVNGLCKIVAYTHHGTISGVQSDSLYTDVTLQKLSTALGQG